MLKLINHYYEVIIQGEMIRKRRIGLSKYKCRMRHTTYRDITSKATKQKQQDQIKNCKLKTNTVFDLITAPALITPPPDVLLYFHLLSPT